MQKQNSHNDAKQHVAVCAFPYGGHAQSLLLLIRRMAAEATDTRFIFLNYETSNATLFKSKDPDFPNIIPRAYPDHASPGKKKMMSYYDIPSSFLEAVPSFLPGCIKAVEAEVGAEIKCVVLDTFVWGCCGDIISIDNITWIPIWICGPNSFITHVYTDVLRTNFQILQGTNKDDEVVDCIPGFSRISYSDLPNGIVAGDLNSIFSKMMYNSGLMSPKATALVINTFEELSPVIIADLKSKMNLLCVGPFNVISPIESDNDLYNCIPWLDKQDPQSVVYISFGTFAKLPKEEAVALAEALNDAKIAFIWSMSDESTMQLLNSVFECNGTSNEMVGKFVRWAPQRKILAHLAIGAFITHCGWNSILESIKGGVPMICRPVVGDQFLNQRFVEHMWGLGVGVEGGVFTKEKVTKALHQVLLNEFGKEMFRERANKLKEEVEGAIKPGGSSDKNFYALLEIITSARG